MTSSKEITIGARKREEQLPIQMRGVRLLVGIIEHGLQPTKYSGLYTEDVISSLGATFPDEVSQQEQLIEQVAHFGEGFRLYAQHEVREFQDSAYLNRMLFSIGLRFGLLGDPPELLGEIGKYFDVSRERVRQIEASAIDAMVHYTQTEDGLTRWQEVRNTLGIAVNTTV